QRRGYLVRVVRPAVGSLRNLFHIPPDPYQDTWRPRDVRTGPLSFWQDGLGLAPHLDHPRLGPRRLVRHRRANVVESRPPQAFSASHDASPLSPLSPLIATCKACEWPTFRSGNVGLFPHAASIS